MRFRKKKGWVVSIERPEEIYKEPGLYYTEKEIEAYSRSGGMKRAQGKIASRIIELLGLEEGKKILDLGCGVGYTSSIFKNNGYDVLGLDVLEGMLDKARAMGLKVAEGDMRDLMRIFKKKEFDAVVSASALQWLTAREDIENVARGIYYVLKDDGKMIIQFYPKSEEEMINTARIFKRQGFEGQIIIDNPENSMKRVIYLVMKKV